MAVVVLVLVLELDAEVDFLGSLVRDFDRVLESPLPPDFFDLELDFFFFDLEGYHSVPIPFENQSRQDEIRPT